MASASSVCNISNTRDTPACPKAPRPHSEGRPISTALAPMASAFRTSVPHREFQITATVIRYHDARCAMLDGQLSVLGREDAFKQHGNFGVGSQLVDEQPGERL